MKREKSNKKNIDILGKRER